MIPPPLYLPILILVLVLLPGLSLAAREPDRFFLMGSGRLHLKNLRNDRETRVDLRNRDGSFNDAAFTEVDRVFGFPTGEKGEHISPRLLFMLSYFADLAAPGRVINIESAYRSPEYNDKIRKKGANAARTSTHMDGMALDFWLEGVGGKELWQQIRAQDCCGVGHYGGKTIHLDAGRPRFWEAMTSGTKTTEPDYNRHIYLSSEYDRYRPGEVVRLSLSGISTFGFGVSSTVGLYGPAAIGDAVAHARIASDDRTVCIPIADRKDARLLSIAVPPGLPAGRYRAKLDFCDKPFSQMPAEVFSNEMEVLRPAVD
jgi:uncharacterized protein YcbK (DUF882 family)